MKLVLDEWIIREVIDTLYMARTTLLGITGLDSPQEVAKKSANESAITRRISKAIDIIQQSEQPQPEVDLEKEIDHYLYGENSVRKYDGVYVPGACMRDWKNPNVGKTLYGNELTQFARHFYELGKNVRKEE